ELAAPVLREIDRQARIAPAPPAVVAHEPVAEGGLGRLLHDGIVGGAHPQPAGIDAVRPAARVRAVALDQPPAHLLHEIAADVALRALVAAGEPDGFGEGGAILLLADEAVAAHFPEHPVAPVERTLEVPVGIVVARA